MKRPMHLAMAFVAVILHLGAPVAAYAAMHDAGRPADFCSVALSALPASSERGAPAPVSHEHHCAHAPCCAGGAVDAAAPPPAVRLALDISLQRESVPAHSTAEAPVSPIAAAQPRGPPLQA